MSKHVPGPQRSLAGALVLAALALSTSLIAAPASAQQVMRMTVGAPMGGFGGMSRPAMSTKDLESYSGILGFDDTQKEAAKELLTSYTAEYEKASKEQQEKIRQI